MADTLPYNLELAKKITGITDEELLKFYIDSIISKISSIVGYNIILSQNKHTLNGLNKTYVYSVARPLKSILQINYDNNDITTECNIVNDRKIDINMILCSHDSVEATYTAGYEVFPTSIQNFLFQQVKTLVTELEYAGLKSYSIETISYSLSDKEKNNADFMNQISNLFGMSL